MQFNQRIYVWIRTSRLAHLLLGILLGSILGFVIYYEDINHRIVHPIYGVLNQVSMPNSVCITADHPLSESNFIDHHTLCASIPRDPFTMQAIELPPKGSRVEAGIILMPITSWSTRTLQMVYLIPDLPIAERISWFFAPQCNQKACYTDTPEEAARLMVLSVAPRELSRTEVEQSFQVQGSQPIDQGMVVFYTRANYRVAVRKEQLLCARLINSVGNRWYTTHTEDYCVQESTTDPIQLVVRTAFFKESAVWIVYGHGTNTQMQVAEVLSTDGSIIRVPIRNGYFLALSQIQTSPYELQVFDGTNHMLLQRDLGYGNDSFILRP